MEDLLMSKERCEMTQKMRNLVDEMFKEIVNLDGFPISDLLDSDPKAMIMFGYVGKAMNLSYDMLDDAYDFMKKQREVNEKLLKEIEWLNKKLDYQETLIRDLTKKESKKNEKE